MLSTLNDIHFTAGSYLTTLLVFFEECAKIVYASIYGSAAAASHFSKTWVAQKKALAVKSIKTDYLQELKLN